MARADQSWRVTLGVTESTTAAVREDGTTLPRAIGVYGAGAIGLDVGVGLIGAGHAVTFIARGETLEALRTVGISHQSGDHRQRIAPSQYAATDSTRAAGPQDYVFLTVKADALATIGGDVLPLLNPDTVVVSATNGIPPWFACGLPELARLIEVAPELRPAFSFAVPMSRILGALVMRSVTRKWATDIEHTSGTGYTIGEPDHAVKPRTLALKALLEGAGLTATLSDDIHRDLWIKLLGNICVNPLSVVTEGTIGEMLDDPVVCGRMRKLVGEAQDVGLRLGVIKPDDFALSDFVAFAEAHLRDHRTSMLQDYLRGKPLELRTILEIVIRLGGHPAVAAPINELRTVHKEVREKLRQRATTPLVDTSCLR